MGKKLDRTNSKLVNFINSTFFRSSMVISISSLAIVSLAIAATTIGANISTGGTLDVEGSYASTTGYLIIGTGKGETIPSAGDALISGNATTSGHFNIGTTDIGGSIPGLFGAGDLYVGNNATVTNQLSVGSVGSAVTTTVIFGNTEATKGACLVFEDDDNTGGLTFCTTLNGTLNCGTADCRLAN